MYIMLLFFSCILGFHLQIVIAKYEGCNHVTCHDCIRDPVNCVWCSFDDISVDQRCKPESSVSDDWCPGHRENPKSTIDGIENQNFITEDAKVELQIKPQKIKMKLRVGEPMEFKFSYKAAKNYSMDLYFLLDLSKSMKDIRNQIVNKSKDIYTAMTHHTDDVYLGLGFFIDKNVIPINNQPDNTTCYSFKHQLNLTNDLDSFKSALGEVEFGYNYDPPEGGLDGLAQVMACKKEISWRENSRKMIIFITDDLFHSAGDGILAGIVNPYDGGCYLNDKGFYMREKDMDYPSTGIISKLAVDEQYTTLFVATRYEEHYETLSSAISGALNVGYDQDKISETLSNVYKQISTNLQLEAGLEAKDSEHFEITFDPDCTNKVNCPIVIGEEKQIKGKIRLRKYYEEDHIEIPIVQKGLKENLTLIVDVISSCDCEHESKTVHKSPDCSFAGDKQCGICKCDPGSAGPTCLCSENSNLNSTSKASCIKDGTECSNNGKCICDGCECQPGFEGPYCEYRNDDCKRDRNGALCSGRGKCRNGVCLCDAYWTGEACECSTSTSGCMEGGINICNDRGKCECGRCTCNSLPSWDVRPYQDEFCNQWPCENCHDRQCRALTSCVACLSSNNTDCSLDCEKGITVVNASSVTEDVRSNWKACIKYHHRVMSGCYSNFSYIYEETERGIMLFVLSEPDCVESYYIYGGISLTILILIGLASLIAWKLITDAQDRDEFMKFLVKAREENEEVINECYEDPTTTFRNPMFKRSFRGSFR